MKLRDLVVAREALGRFLALELPAATAFKIARATRPVQAELQNYERQRVALVQRLGEDAGQGQIMVLPEKSAEFNEEMNALLDVDVELEIRKIDIGIFGETNIRAADLMVLWFLFEQKEEE